MAEGGDSQGFGFGKWVRSRISRMQIGKDENLAKQNACLICRPRS